MISVIIPTKDRAEDLLACLNGLVHQNAPGLLAQVIVVDDHSQVSAQNDVLAFSKSHGLQTLFLTNPPGRGAAVARNYGSQYAIGSILAFLDDDSIPDENWLRTVMEYMQNDKVAAITGRILPLDRENLFSQARQLRYDLRQKQALSSGWSVTFLAGGNGAMRKSVFEKLGGFNADFKMMHDREIIHRMNLQGWHCIYAHDLLVRHRHYKGTGNVILGSFFSGRYRLLLESRYSIKRWSLAGQIRSIRQIGREISRPEKLLPALLAITTEIIHSGGYWWFRSQQVVGRGP